MRLAPSYYIFWFILWSVQARIASGPIWYFTNITFETCDQSWAWSFFWLNNL